MLPTRQTYHNNSRRFYCVATGIQCELIRKWIDYTAVCCYAYGTPYCCSYLHSKVHRVAFSCVCFDCLSKRARCTSCQVVTPCIVSSYSPLLKPHWSDLSWICVVPVFNRRKSWFAANFSVPKQWKFVKRILIFICRPTISDANKPTNYYRASIFPIRRKNYAL